MTAMTDRLFATEPAGTAHSSELVARVKELQPLIRQNAARGEGLLRGRRTTSRRCARRASSRSA